MPSTKSTARPTPRKAPARKTHAVAVHHKASKPATVSQWLLFRDAIVNELPAQRIIHIRSGVKAPTLVDAAKYIGLTLEEIFCLVGLPVSTANRKIAKRQTLEVPATERLARLALIERQAEETFGDTEMAHNWLQADNAGLGNCTPLSLLDTDVGAREVSKVLVAIAHGGAA